MEEVVRPITIRPLEEADILGAVALQRACFPPPFPEELLWTAEHLQRHLRIFPEGQFVAVAVDEVVASASALIVAESSWQAHQSWETTTGGHFFDAHDPEGSTLYGADISVHPEWRGRGIGRTLYQARFKAVRRLGLRRFGTACRIPDYRAWNMIHREGPEAYARAVVAGQAADRTLTPLLKAGMTYLALIEDYMEDAESADCAALLEWTP